MNVNGVGGLGGWTGINPGGLPRKPGVEEGQTARPVREQAAPVAPAVERQDALPVDAPGGTDPQLWSVLTSEERTFFARARAMGPLTYGPGAQRGPAGPARGGRVDIRI